MYYLFLVIYKKQATDIDILIILLCWENILITLNVLNALYFSDASW